MAECSTVSTSSHPPSASQAAPSTNSSLPPPILLVPKHLLEHKIFPLLDFRALCRLARTCTSYAKLDLESTWKALIVADYTLDPTVLAIIPNRKLSPDAIVSFISTCNFLPTWRQCYEALFGVERALCVAHKLALTAPPLLPQPLPQFMGWGDFKAADSKVIACGKTYYGYGSYAEEAIIQLASGGFRHVLVDAIDPSHENQIYEDHKVEADSLEELVCKLLASEKGVPQPSLCRLHIYRRSHLLRFMAGHVGLTYMSPFTAPTHVSHDLQKAAWEPMQAALAGATHKRITLELDAKKAHQTLRQVELPCLSISLFNRIVFEEAKPLLGLRGPISKYSIQLRPRGAYKMPGSLAYLEDGATVVCTFTGTGGR